MHTAARAMRLSKGGKCNGENSQVVAVVLTALPKEIKPMVADGIERSSFACRVVAWAWGVDAVNKNSSVHHARADWAPVCQSVVYLCTTGHV